jgi:hypothetical protein
MGRKRSPGLYQRQGIWHIDKVIFGRRICESSGSSSAEEAERFLARISESIRQQMIYGVRPDRTFREAATKYLNESCKRSLARDAQDLVILDRHIGELRLRQVHMGTLAPYIAARRADGVKSATVNRSLAVVRRILNLAARLWRDEAGMTWLETPPLLQFVDWGDRHDPYPISWDEQTTLFQCLPPHLTRMALFKVNTGCREQEVCKLRWDWEVQVPELSTSVFIIPREWVKNGEDRLVVLNSVASSVVEGERGKHPTHVFTYRGNPVTKMYNGAWKRAREKVGLKQVRIHDLKHTFGRRLRAAGVPLETRKVLLGHKSGDITTHYSGPELEELIEAANRVCGGGSRKSPALVVLRKRTAGAGV